MTDAVPRTAPTDEHGVVDPIRIPGANRIAREWRRLPLLARVLLVAAGIDAVARLIGLGGLSLSLNLTAPFGFLGFFLPHYAVVLLPVVLLARRRDALEATPLVVRGAVALAVVELAGDPLGLLFLPSGSDITGWTAVQIAGAAARAGGYVALAFGLRALDRSIPGPTLAGLANLVAWLIAGSAVVGLLLQLAFPPPELGDPSWNAQLLLVSSVNQLTLVAFAYLARAVIRGGRDDRRPAFAVTLGAGAMVLAGIVGLLNVLTGVVVLVQTVFAIPAGLLTGAFAFAGLGPPVFLLLLVVAFALGLADTSVRIPGRGEPGFVPDPQPDPIHWPTSFEEQNVPYHPELVPNPRAAASTATPVGQDGAAR